jgi:hypothetical protein
VVTGSASLLRPSPAPLVRAAVLGFLAFAVAPPLATAASHAPDPSPHYGLVAPDPYPTPQASPAPRTISAPVTSVRRLPVTVKSPAARGAPKKAVVRSTQPVEPLRIPDHAAPRLVALAQQAVDSSQHVPRKLVLALGALVLLSASLVAGAARELAR